MRTKDLKSTKSAINVEYEEKQDLFCYLFFTYVILLVHYLNEENSARQTKKKSHVN